ARTPCSPSEEEYQERERQHRPTEAAGQHEDAAQARGGLLLVHVERADDLQDAAHVACLPVLLRTERVAVVAIDTTFFHYPRLRVAQHVPALVFLELGIWLVGVLAQVFQRLGLEVVARPALVAGLAVEE